MALTHNLVFRLLEPSHDGFPVGLYRVILDEPAINKTVAVFIDPLGNERRPVLGGRPKNPVRKRIQKKPAKNLVGELLWIERDDLLDMERRGTLQVMEYEREAIYLTPISEGHNAALYAKRLRTMAPFLDFYVLREGILKGIGLSLLVEQAMQLGPSSRVSIYRQWSNLCRYGIDEGSLRPRLDRCGAKGMSRPCDPGGRKKAGRKTRSEELHLRYGVPYEHSQPGMSSEWAAAIRAADRRIKSPKPRWKKRYDLIINSAFVSKIKQEGDKVTFVLPEKGQYPNLGQIKRVVEAGLTMLQRLAEKTTKHHLKSALRGLVARNWRDVPGPGHTWAIDSTIGDIYLRSSVNPAWIVGRPVVYVIVDVWSTAVVGFYVCLVGPSWDTAKISLFNATADPSLLGELWGYQPMICLSPHPSMCFQLMCDRGEYLSKGQRATALKLIQHTGILPPYRGDLKGLAEVLHRIEKDDQFLFVPGAMDFRRKELELRKVDPDDCVMTIRHYTAFLYDLFWEYNLTANREHRLDAHMAAVGVIPSPAGLWAWGHQMGVGFNRKVGFSELASNLLSEDKAHIGRSSIRFRGNDYMSELVQQRGLTTLSRNFGGIHIPAYYYPGSVSRIWTPNTGANGLMELRITDQSPTSPEVTYEEMADVLALKVMSRADWKHEAMKIAQQRLIRQNEILREAKTATTEAIDRASGKLPSMTEARIMEVAAGETIARSASEAATINRARDEAMDAHLAMMQSLYDSAGAEEEHA